MTEEGNSETVNVPSNMAGKKSEIVRELGGVEGENTVGIDKR